MTTPRPAILLFRNDLRLSDHPALTVAAAGGKPVICLYVNDPDAPDPIGRAQLWWLHHSLAALGRQIADLSGQLVLRAGKTRDVLGDVIRATGADAVHWSRRYTPNAIAADTALKAHLNDRGIHVESHAGRYLFEPWQIATKAGTPFRVFTPFWRSCLAQLDAAPAPLPAPDASFMRDLPSETLEGWGGLPTRPNWAAGFGSLWTPGEAGAMARLDSFLDKRAQGYAQGRDFPAATNVSNLSPHLQMGEITPRQILASLRRAEVLGDVGQRDGAKFLAEVGWRDFSAYLLYHNPTLPLEEFQPKFAPFPWRDDAKDLTAWQRGQTGYPIVDAGMRELLQTGTMHNRVRMIVASFLIKHLRINWRAGLSWFHDTLLDADVASNAASWQWVAGCGADAAPYFRIFNPITQATKFDPDGTYIRQWVPEIAALPDKYLGAPWKAPSAVLQAAHVTLGMTYPHPIVDHARARTAALAAFEGLSASAENVAIGDG
ncbi:deoxyribodipyrimidine photo-lyase [Aliiroseovarius halocynthiae]|uniref:Deoxyribodipyrimidine photo-lyase n=1 Tax=Aliiroseovarius halocynthiae TaxID=985055 RepID=A0A545SN19_9RHOB|nr:deoxyribodipyrimidine photo-lyase [Aliiroseovarius halocynthiae]TQV66373.1 deoxyribodipyrimidine photo-lyase [Aliiroseovarius halocynthiae]SMR83348.1 deoxyribodipyrimidine photo-lyase [Aliiroseovarius halocynthiae]